MLILSFLPFACLMNTVLLRKFQILNLSLAFLGYNFDEKVKTKKILVNK